MELKTKLIVAAVVALLLSALVGGSYLYISGLKNTIREDGVTIAGLNLKVGSLESANSTMRAAILAQNTKMQELIKAQEQASQEADKAIRVAQASTKVWKSKYQSLASAPKPSGTDCQALATRVQEIVNLRLEEAGNEN